ncbi:DUF4129 domain-containing protein [Halosimplex halophilum]|uniref:DUF4129 domain-containing protein n=1 Tax=Halosimplex halophilum TaxID=2559572 RepID=UPI00107FAE3D|nr:DUF4129 domain-containing protein [Halosimplex halophilum]
MQRPGTALVGLLALVALAGAAGTFGAVDGPVVTGDGTPTRPATPTEVPPPTGAPGGASESEVHRAATATTAAAGDSGGVSPFVVPAVGGSLLAAGLLVVFLTGHDERAPEVPDDGPGGGDPTPAVDPAYDSPDENAVTRAWRRLRDRAGADESTTPGDVATRALDAGLPGSAVATVTERFRAVRYGEGSPSADGSDPAATAVERLEPADSSGAEDDPDTNEGRDTDGEPGPGRGR